MQPSNTDNWERIEISYEDIMKLIEASKTEKYGFEPDLLTHVLSEFCAFFDALEQEELHLFKRLFTSFEVSSYFASENLIDITVTLFEYIAVVDDLFLPRTTAEHFVQKTISEYFYNKHNIRCNVTIKFVVN